MRYAIIGVEGPHDQAFVGKVLKLLGFKDFREELKGIESDLDPFWRKFIPVRGLLVSTTPGVTGKSGK